MRFPVLLLALLGSVTAAKAGCGSLPGACEMENGTYHAALPENVGKKTGTVLFLHGFGSSGAGSMKNSGMVNVFLERGYAFIAPDGAEVPGEAVSRGKFWNFRGRTGRDDTAFLRAVAQDAARRFGIDGENVLLTGFSMGAFEVAYLACGAPQAFAAYAPLAGGFWRPAPESCNGPVRMFHTHGWRDNTVPLEGRRLGMGAVQGDIFAEMDVWRKANKCETHNPDGFSVTGQFLRRRWISCAPGSTLEFALHPGGHGIPKGWADMVLDWFEGKN